MSGKEQDEKEHLEWVNSQPPWLKKVLLKHFMPTMADCYRTKDDPAKKGHYRIYTFDRVRDKTTGEIVDVQVTLYHGHDSFWPGTQIFGFHPEDLIPCNCGKFIEPTKDDVTKAKKEAEKRHNGTHN